MIERRFKSFKKYNDVALTTAAGPPVIVTPVDISSFERFNITYQNYNTAIAFLDMVVQVSQFTDASAADTPLEWANLPTTTLSVPSALGPTAVTVTGLLNNAWHYVRVLGRTSQTAATGRFSITIGGF